MLCATRERGDDDRELADRAAEQQQPDQEQQMIRADQDVVDAGRQELLRSTANAPCRVPAKYSNRGAAAVENRLRQRVAFVDVEEGLMLRIVRKHHRVDRQPARRARERVTRT